MSKASPFATPVAQRVSPQTPAAWPVVGGARSAAPTTSARNRGVLILSTNPRRARQAVEALRAKDLAVEQIGGIDYLSESELKHHVVLPAREGAAERFDLRRAEQVVAFSRALGLSVEQAARVAHVVVEAPGGMTAGREVLAELVKSWSRAERGEEVPAHLVLDTKLGSLVGTHGLLRLETIASLATTMPKAANAIEVAHVLSVDLSERELVLLRSAFRSLRAIRVYHGPGAAALTVHNGELAGSAAWVRPGELTEP